MSGYWELTREIQESLLPVNLSERAEALLIVANDIIARESRESRESEDNSYVSDLMASLRKE